MSKLVVAYGTTGALVIRLPLQFEKVKHSEVDIVDPRLSQLGRIEQRCLLHKTILAVVCDFLSKDSGIGQECVFVSEFVLELKFILA